jgi:signal transduction histidine kinase
VTQTLDNHTLSYWEPVETLRHELDIDFDRQAVADSSECAAPDFASLGEMTAGIAHDFRNVLAVIDSSLRLALNSKQLEQASTYIAAAREGVVRGTQLAAQLVAFAKQRKLEPEAGDANELLRNLEPFLRYGAGPEIRTALELAPEIPKCLVDPSQFNAAILNLVINARDAMPHGGQITITTELWTPGMAMCDSPDSRTYVRVRVKDQGQGMSDDVVRQIFHPFFTTKGENGTGLGLPQVCAFMRLVGGHVTVDSERGLGTSFSLFFPALERGAA